MHCRESARLLSEQRDRTLPFRKRVGLWFHLLVCRLCKVYAAQLRVLTGVSAAAGIAAADHCPGHLSDAQRNRIRTELQKDVPPPA